MQSRVYYKQIGYNIEQIIIYRPYNTNPITGYTFANCSTIFSTITEAKEAYNATNCSEC